MQIRTATDQDQPAWDAYVLEHPEGVAYHRYAWGQAIWQAYSFAPVYLLAEQQGRLCGVLPLIEMRIPLRRPQLISLPYCDLGGILADDEAVSVALLAEARQRAQEQRASRLELRQSVPQIAADNSPKVRMLLDLPASSEELLAGFKAKLRSQIKKPGRDGLTAQLGGREQLDVFYRVFATNMRDLGSPVHSRAWFRAILDGYGQDARLGVVWMPDGSAAAVGLILLHQHTVSIPWASALRRYNRENPNMLLYWTFLAFAADHNYARFDFGRSTPGEGTYRFKQQWGAQPLSLRWQSLLDRHQGQDQDGPASGTLRSIAEQVWAHLPVSVATCMGSALRKYISL